MIQRWHRDGVRYWESAETAPNVFEPSCELHEMLLQAHIEKWPSLSRAPFDSRKQIKAGQLRRIKELVSLAYERIPLYRAKYQAAGIAPRDIANFDDFAKIPPVKKNELIAAFPDQCVDLSRFNSDELFTTRSSGSSGFTLPIYVDPKSILLDTLQGVRQFWLQSAKRYEAGDRVVHLCTIPWWFSSVGGSYLANFISSLIPPVEVGKILKNIGPEILACYPSNLQSLTPYLKGLSSLYLVVTHSEQSSRFERLQISSRLGVPVLDEYSSEEATRIALELPCGHYHLCEDAVYTEILDPVTLQPQKAGEAGLVTITNLLNEAMPFIRYIQGDVGRLSGAQRKCDVHWEQLESIDGRVGDSFITSTGRTIPSGTLLDITYRWMYDCDINIGRFELVQPAGGNLRMVVEKSTQASDQELVDGSIFHLEKLLGLAFGETVCLDVIFVDRLAKGRKRRPIRREVPKRANDDSSC